MPRLARRLLLIALLSSCLVAQAAAPRVGLVTMLDGEAAVLRDGARLALAEGAALLSGDLLSTGPQTRLLRIEFADKANVSLGPDSRAMLAPGVGQGSGQGDPHAALYLLAGWAKLGTPAGVASGILSPAADIAAAGGSAVIATQATGVQVFAETGPLQLRLRGPDATTQTLKAGEMLTLAAGAARPALANGPTPAFVQAIPRAFMDSLPSRAAAFQGKDVAPKRLGAMSYADAQPWLDAEPALRRVFVRRWRGLAADPEFRRGLVAGLKSHPEWEPVLYPPPPRPPKPASAAVPLH
jgi:hypothetical protein